MKIKLNINIKKYSEVKKKLESHGIIITDESEYVLNEVNAYIETITCKKEDKIYVLNVNDIICFESYGHEILINNEYTMRSPLNYLETMLPPEKFIRINSSTIVNSDYIDFILPLIGMKFKITLINGKKLDVNRSFYYSFKEKIGF